jgi:hypothetical protein
MVFPIVGGTQSTGYDVDNSLRINAGDSAFLSRTQTAGNQRTFTVSAWVKRARLNDRQALFSSTTDGSNECFIWFDTDDELFVKENTSNSTDFEIRTNRKFRDPSAWYHIVVAYDTTNSTSGDRVRIYVNGVEETSFANETQPDQNFQTKFNKNSQALDIGRMNYGQEYFGGYLTEIHWVDGSQLAPTSFGEFDDNGVWIPKKYTGSYGTNGYFLQFKQTGTSQNSSGIGADTSGEDNHFAVTNLAATDITEDTCTNNFCTMNPLYSYTGITFSEGNLQTNLGGSNHRWGTGTFFVESGKWYFECKVLSDNNLNSGPGVIAYGIDDPLTTEGGGAGSKAEGWIYLATSNGQLQHGNSTYGTASAATTNDILMVAFDVDNGKIWIGKNGTWSEGSNPSTGNGAVREDLGDASSGLFTPAISGYNENFQFNFGNPPFSISSGNTDGKYGNFEYAPPSGYYALCTKRLAEFG